MERLAVIAEALLDAGWLQSRDWNGELALSVSHGLGRFASKFVWKVLKLRLFLADDISKDECPHPGSYWHAGPAFCGYGRTIHSYAKPRIGMIALLHNPYEDLPAVFLGPRCLQLDRLLPGAGTTIFNLITMAAATTIGGFTPLGASWWWDVEYQNRVDYVGELEAEQEVDETDPQGVLTDTMADFIYEQERLDGFPDPQAFRELFPAGLFRQRIAKRLLRRAAKQLPADAPRALQKAMRYAIELLDAFMAFFEFRKANRELLEKYDVSLNADQTLPLGVLWNEQDAVGRMIDEYLERLEGIEVTEVCAAGCFDPNDPVSLQIAIQHTDHVLRVLQPLDKVLHYLHGDLPPEERRAPRPLVEVLGEGPLDQPSPVLPL